MQLEQALIAVEKQIEEVSAALLALDGPQLERSSTALRDAAAQFSWALDAAQPRSALPAPVQKRVNAAVQMLAVQRENLARVAAITDRQVQAMIPQTASAATYGKAHGGQGRAGGAARIYSSAG